ncbi:DUF3817 domain-containing protein, partial [Streptomyces sp. NPDC002130]|uniref:DUF3817 domain-containing protein n=1 Tax=Streptomyces sp. NPDC002130 TaxID=3155568 RepID=UPI0033328BB1
MSTGSEASIATPAVNAEKQKKVASALVRYRVLAWITGLWLLFLTGEMVYKYLILDNSADAPSWLFYIGQIHGLFYTGADEPCL